MPGIQLLDSDACPWSTFWFWCTPKLSFNIHFFSWTPPPICMPQVEAEPLYSAQRNRTVTLQTTTAFHHSPKAQVYIDTRTSFYRSSAKSPINTSKFISRVISMPRAFPPTTDIFCSMDVNQYLLMYFNRYYLRMRLHGLSLYSGRLQLRRLASGAGRKLHWNTFSLRVSYFIRTGEKIFYKIWIPCVVFDWYISIFELYKTRDFVLFNPNYNSIPQNPRFFRLPAWYFALFVVVFLVTFTTYLSVEIWLYLSKYYRLLLNASLTVIKREPTAFYPKEGQQ